MLCNSVELTWDPYLDLKDCDRGGRNCTTTGIMAEALQFVAKLTNFKVNMFLISSLLNAKLRFHFVLAGGVRDPIGR